MTTAGAASTARLSATGTAPKMTTDAFRVCGWSGHTKDYRVERHAREAKAMRISGGTNQIQRLVISRDPAN